MMADDRDEHVTTLFVGPHVAPERRQDPEQDRKDRHREADQEGGRGGPVTAVKHRQQRSAQGRSENDRNGQAKRRTGESYVLSGGPLAGGEVSDLEEQSTRHREFDRDHRLEELNRNVFDHASPRPGVQANTDGGPASTSIIGPTGGLAASLWSCPMMTGSGA
jgi:hypothetical protein